MGNDTTGHGAAEQAKWEGFLQKPGRRLQGPAYFSLDYHWKESVTKSFSSWELQGGLASLQNNLIA